MAAFLVAARHTQNRFGWCSLVNLVKEMIRIAEKLVDEIDGLKGLIMKFGRIASYVGTGMSPKAQQILARLQKAGTAMEFSTVRFIVEAEFGAPLETIFDDFSPTPIAAASIGQVHQARYKGRTVAVKIQYPEIEDVIKSDLRTVGKIAWAMFLSQETQTDVVLQDLQDRLLEECDYRNEMLNQIRFRKIYNNDPDIYIPEVIPERCTKRVFTSEWIEGRDFYEFLAHATQAEKNRAGAAIWRFGMNSIYRYALFNADPHPGNYLFLPSGQVCFLDFGCVKIFSTDYVAQLSDYALSVRDGDHERFKQLSYDLKLVSNRRKVDWDHLWRLMEYTFRIWLQDDGFTVTHQYVNDSVSLMLFENPNRFSSIMQPESLWLFRITWGQNSILADLQASASWRTMGDQCLGKQPVSLAEIDQLPSHVRNNV